MASPGTCAECGRPLDEHNRHLRFNLPQPVLDLVPNEEERAAKTWGNDVLMQVRGVGAFVRVLVPVNLTGGYSVTFGAWLGVEPAALRRAYEVWWKPEYLELRLDGVLANMLPPWEADTYPRPLEAAPRVMDEVPYATVSSDETVTRILTEQWPHQPVLEAVAPYFR